MQTDFTTPYFAKAREGIKKLNDKGDREELPVHQVVDKVVKSVTDGKITILTADTGSGKTLLASTMLADASDHQVVVLVPRRFLAENAAQAVASISGTTNGREVGYAIGKQAGDGPNCDPKQPKLLFCTYGYALSAGILDTAKTIVLDEVHEAGIETSLARAMIHRRLQTDKGLRVMEMSATINAKKQAEYWQNIPGKEVAEPIHAEGKAFPCIDRHEPELGIVTVAQEMLGMEKKGRDIAEEEQGRGGKKRSRRDEEPHHYDARSRKGGKPVRNGIAIFLEGVNEVKTMAAQLQEALGDKVEVAMIYGDMDAAQRAEAIRAPKNGRPKILIGTNVMESGVNIEWLDAGISNGKTKIPFSRESGANALVTQDLPQWRITQQLGRVNRFRPGEFVLCAEKARDDKRRPVVNTPEIERVSLTGLVMQAAGYRVNPLELTFDAKVDRDKLIKAHTALKRMGLIDDDWRLTEKGQYVNRLPLGANAGSMLWAAKDKELFSPAIFNDAIELAAIAETGGIRADFRESHKFYKRDHVDVKSPDVVKSDVLEAFHTFKKLGYNAEEEKCDRYNVSWKRYKEVKQYIKDIRKRHHIAIEEHGQAATPGRAATDHELQQIMLHGSVNNLFQIKEKEYESLLDSEDHTRYRASDGSVLTPPKEQHPTQGRDKAKHNMHSRHFNDGERFAIADLREIPHGGTVAQNITPVSINAFLEFAANSPGVLTDIEIVQGKKSRKFLAAKYFGDVEMEFQLDKIPNELLNPLLEQAGITSTEHATRRSTLEEERKPKGVGNKGAHEPKKRKGKGGRRNEDRGNPEFDAWLEANLMTSTPAPTKPVANGSEDKPKRDDEPKEAPTGAVGAGEDKPVINNGMAEMIAKAAEAERLRREKRDRKGGKSGQGGGRE